MPGPGKTRNQNVLLVDDQAQVRMVVRRILEREGGYAVAEASNAATALALAEEAPPDAVILDISMPGGPGFMAISKLKAISATMKVLVLSSHYAMEDEVIAMGADAFLPKTAEPKEVLATLAGIIAS